MKDIRMSTNEVYGAQTNMNGIQNILINLVLIPDDDPNV